MYYKNFFGIEHAFQQEYEVLFEKSVFYSLVLRCFKILFNSLLHTRYLCTSITKVTITKTVLIMILKETHLSPLCTASQVSSTINFSIAI